MKTFWSKNAGFFGRIVSGTAALIFCCLPVLGQSSPPMMVQVPFVSVAAGGAAANCGGALDADGDGCPATQILIPAQTYSTAVDKWGNIYFGEINNTSAVGVARVIYAGAVTVGGVVNPAAAMIEAANDTLTWTTAPVAGDVYTVAGGLTAGPGSGATCRDGVPALSSNGSGCSGTDSYLKKVYGVAVDGEGNVFLLDESNSVAYVVLANASGLGASYVTTVTPSATPTVGSIYIAAGAGGGYVDGVLATAGKIHAPYGIAVDASDNVYISDYSDNAVRMVNGPNTTSGGFGPGYIHTIAGNCTSSACTALAAPPDSNTPAIGAAFVDPGGIAVDSYGNVYVGDNADSIANVPATVRVIYAGGTNNPVANLIGIETGFSSPIAGDVYTIAGSSTIFDKQTPAVDAATGNGALATDSSVTFDRIYGLAVDGHGNVIIADYDGATNMSVAEVNAATGYLSFIGGGSVAGTLGSGDNCAGGLAGPIMTDALGDGCPATQGSLHHVEGNPSFDASGNLYVADLADGMIRELSFSSFPATTVATSAPTQSLAFSLLTGATSEAASSVSSSVELQGDVSTEFVNAVTGDTCTGSTTLVGFPNTAGTQANSTCVIPVIFTPLHPGARSGALMIGATVNSVTQTLATAYLSGVGNGSLLTIDPSTPTQSNAGTTPLGVAVDDGLNTYAVWANGALSTAPAGPYNTNIATGLSSTPSQIAIDGAGNVYVADAGNDRIAEYVGGATTPISAVGGLSNPKGVAVDAAGNLYIADTGNSRVLFQPYGNGQQMVLGSGFDTPVAVAVDANDNVYVADSGLGKIIEIAANNGTQTTVASGIKPVSLAVDAGGNIVYAESEFDNIVEIPANGATTVLANGTSTPNGVALDVNGGMYVAYSGNTYINDYSRTASDYDFASLSDSDTVVLTNAGNVAYSEPFTQSDASDFTVAGSAGNGCTFTSPLGLAAGTNCGLTSTFTPVNSGNLTDSVSFNGGSDALVLSGYNASTVVATTTSLGSLNPGSPTYGDTVTITATVAPTSGSSVPTGTVSFTVDGGTPSAAYSLTSGAYTYTLPALSAGSHTVSASYTPSGSFTASTSTSFPIDVAQLAITATVTTTTPVDVPYGQAVPTINGTLAGVLGGDTANVTPVFTSTASAGSPVNGGTGYPINVTLNGSAAPNYSVTITGTPTVVIQAASVNVTVNSTSKVYGAANPTFTGTPSGVYGSDPVTVNYSTTATQYSAVNGATGYPITATGLNLSGSATGNYVLGTVTGGTLTITPLAITASVTSPVDVIYGSAIPSLTGTLNGVVNSDNVAVALTTTAVQGDSVANYPITLAATPLTGSAAGNYSVTLTGTPMVAIQALAITATPTPESVAYGVAVPAPTGTLNGVLPADTNNVIGAFTTTAVAGDAVGNYPITLASPALTGSASGNYSVTLSGSASVTITQASTTTNLTELAPSVGVGSEASFTATVSSAGGTPTGSIIFSTGSTTLCTLTLSSGSATCSTDSLPVGNPAVTAVYQGSTNFTTSTSNSVNETVTIPQVTGTPTGSSTVTIAGGSTGTVTLTITASGGYVGTATYGCGLLPAFMTCSFNPATSTFTSTSTTATTVLTISTKPGATTTAMLNKPAAPSRQGGMSPVLAAGILLPGALLGLLGFSKRRRQWQRNLMLLVLLVTGMAGMAAISGCGASNANQVAPGSYTILVDITAGTQTTVPVTVVVQ